MGRFRYRQLFLFLGVLIFPAIMITVQGRRILAQEKELAKTRLEEIRKRTAAEIGQEIVTRLERIKTQEMANMPEALSNNSDPAVVAVGWLEGEQLVWPWDGHFDPEQRPVEDPEFDRALNDARRAEFGERRYDRVRYGAVAPGRP